VFLRGCKGAKSLLRAERTRFLGVNVLIFRRLLRLGLRWFYALHWLLQCRDINTNRSTLFLLLFQPPLPVSLVCDVLRGLVICWIELRALCRLLLGFSLLLLIPLVL